MFLCRAGLWPLFCALADAGSDELAAVSPAYCCVVPVPLAARAGCENMTVIETTINKGINRFKLNFKLPVEESAPKRPRGPRTCTCDSTARNCTSFEKIRFAAATPRAASFDCIARFLTRYPLHNSQSGVGAKTAEFTHCGPIDGSDRESINAAPLRESFWQCYVPPPEPGRPSRVWHTSPTIDIAGYHFSWVWVLVPTFLVNSDDLVFYIYALMMGATLAHRHYGLPYAYLDEGVFHRSKRQLTWFPLVCILTLRRNSDDGQA